MIFSTLNLQLNLRQHQFHEDNLSHTSPAVKLPHISRARVTAKVRPTPPTIKKMVLVLCALATSAAGSKIL